MQTIWQKHDISLKRAANPKQIMTLTHSQEAMSKNVLAKTIQRNVLVTNKEHSCVGAVWDVRAPVLPPHPTTWDILTSCCVSIRLMVMGFTLFSQGTWVSSVSTCLGGLIRAIQVLHMDKLESFFALGHPKLAFEQEKRSWNARMGNGGLIRNRVGSRCSYMPTQGTVHM